MTEKLTIEIWSDIACPFCYMGDALLQQALATTPHEGEVEARYRSFQLMPELPPDTDMNATELLVRAKGMSRAQAAALNAQITERARALGLEYHLDEVRAVNTRAAHRLSHFALEEGKQHALMQRLFRAYFTEGANVAEPEALASFAAEVGLDRDRALEVVREGAYEREVVEDMALARELGIRGVPFFLFNRKYAVSGAQPLEVFLKALDAAWGASP